MIIAKYLLLISALIELDLMSTNEYKAVGLIGLVGGACLILFRKKIARVIVQPADNWAKEPVPQQELKLGLKRTEMVRICERLGEVIIVIAGILVFAMGLPSFVPILHRPVMVICLSFFFIFLPAIMGASMLALALYPLCEWKLRKYRKNESSIPQQILLSQLSQDNDDIVLRKLRKEANKYSMICLIITFIICLLIAIKIALIFDIFK